MSDLLGAAKDAPRTERQTRRDKRDENEPRVTGQVRLLDDPPDMYERQEAKNHAGRDDVGPH